MRRVVMGAMACLATEKRTAVYPAVLFAYCLQNLLNLENLVQRFHIFILQRLGEDAAVFKKVAA